MIITTPHTTHSISENHHPIRMCRFSVFSTAKKPKIIFFSLFHTNFSIIIFHNQNIIHNQRRIIQYSIQFFFSPFNLFWTFWRKKKTIEIDNHHHLLWDFIVNFNYKSQTHTEDEIFHLTRKKTEIIRIHSQNNECVWCVCVNGNIIVEYWSTTELNEEKRISINFFLCEYL